MNEDKNYIFMRRNCLLDAPFMMATCEQPYVDTAIQPNCDKDHCEVNGYFAKKIGSVSIFM